ncbi:MAG TPA: hypothetical protein VH120_02045 [Gemmataceae bacterium]|jgi:hypothetical protein|nr:hypothetical protein [Gemmataceae bacterium]
MKRLQMLIHYFCPLGVVSLVALQLWGAPPETKPQEDKVSNHSIIEAVVWLDTSKKGCLVGIKLTDRALIKQLVEDPIDKAHPEPKPPPAYVDMGQIDLKRKDGTIESIWLFGPWGKLKRGEKYLSADLKALRALVLESVKEAQ